jgi:hypothetical protein
MQSEEEGRGDDERGRSSARAASSREACDRRCEHRTSGMTSLHPPSAESPSPCRKMSVEVCTAGLRTRGRRTSAAETREHRGVSDEIARDRAHRIMHCIDAIIRWTYRSTR